MPSVAVAVPLHSRSYLMPDEEISIRHLLHYLGRYDRYLISPRSSDLRLRGFGLKRFSDGYFGSVDANKRLLLSRRFYEAFQDYEYVLIYHLDALVFSDQLEEWCDQAWDYIGAPWLAAADDPVQGFSMVGNGGFSLRRVPSFLRVFDSRRYRVSPEVYRRRFFARRSFGNQLLNYPRLYLKRLNRFNGPRWEMRSYGPNEDGFWSKRAQHYDPRFRVAPVEAGLRFAFECAPRYCFEQNNRRLPFGCHAWTRYDRAFWEPYLLTSPAMT